MSDPTRGPKRQRVTTNVANVKKHLQLLQQIRGRPNFK